MNQPDVPFREEDLEAVRIRALVMDPVSSVPVIVLESEADGTLLPIWIGLCEANAIALAMEDVSTPRPMTHDLFVSVIETTGHRIDRVVIHSLEHNVFQAVLLLSGANGSLPVDSRPSDALALAVRTRTPLFVTREVLTEAAFRERSESELIRTILEKIPAEDLGRWKM